MRKRLIPILIITPIIIAIFIFVMVLKTFNSSYQGEQSRFRINAGEGFSSVNYRLGKQKLISSPRLFHYYSKYTNSLSSLKAGEYIIKNGMTMTDILQKFINGEAELTKVTIPEGKNLYEVAGILEENGVVNAKTFIKMAKDQEVVKKFGLIAPSLEGYLFPETYLFSPKMPEIQVIESMFRQFKLKTKNLNFSKADNLTPHQVIILASIVEKETGAKWERPTIAGVYLNRLAKKMRLQADPTTIYGIWENYNGNLRRKHLQEKTPYNTYRISGLPLGPIANPSLAAIEAVLEPAKHNYIYFVSKNDGTHVFTPTYKEHEKAVDYWQRNRSRRTGKSWRDLKQKK